MSVAHARRGDAAAPQVSIASGLSRHAQRGFTLLELLVALAIFAIVGPAIYSTFTATLAGRDRALQRAQAYSAARGALDRIESDLRANLDVGVKGSLLPRFFAPGSGQGFGSGRRMAAGDQHLLLDLTTLSARGVTAAEGYVAIDELSAKTADRGDQARVVWRLEQADGDSDASAAQDSMRDDLALVRYEIKPPRNEEVDLSVAPRQVIAQHVSLRLDFYAAGEWTDAWDSQAPGPQHDLAPTLVRTTVQLNAGDEEPLVLVSATVLALAADKRHALNGGLRPGRSDKPDRKGDGGAR